MRAVLSTLRDNEVKGAMAHMFQLAIPFNKLTTRRSRKPTDEDDNDNLEGDLKQCHHLVTTNPAKEKR